jgi:hypothetical protein
MQKDNQFYLQLRTKKHLQHFEAIQHKLRELSLTMTKAPSRNNNWPMMLHLSSSVRL